MRLVAKYTFAVALFAAALIYRFGAGSVALAQQPAAPAAQAGPPGGQAGPAGPAGAGAGAGRGRGGPTPGALLWAQHCSGCHGNDSAGGRAPSLFDQKWVDSTTDDKIVSAIKNGVPNTEMTGFGASLTDEQIFQLIQHIRTTSGAPTRPRAQFVEAPNGTVIKSAKQTFKVELVTDGLMTPWAMAFLPDGRMLVTERDGRLQIVDKGKLTLVTGTPKAHVQQDGGYLDVEVHPRYASNGWIYLAYSEDQPDYVAPPAPPADPAPPAAPPAGGAAQGRGGRGGTPFVPSMTVIVRGKIDKNNAWTDQQTIFRAPSSLYTTSGAHYGSRMLFDRENHLYFTLGERNGNNPNYAQDLTSPLGKVHRVNDDGTAPKDNPFVNTPGAVASIWTYGHRNPEGLAWDPVTGNLWESEHGPNTADEINLLIKGHNYGWNLVSKQGPPQYKLSAPGMDDPVVYFMPTFAPAGISFYTGNRYPGWKNTSLFVCGLAGQALRRMDVKGGTITGQEIVFDQFGRVRDIVQGPDGYFYIAVQNPTGVANPGGGNISLSASTPGRIIRLVPTS
jgi:glucose/arabinose dehydrogenase